MIEIIDYSGEYANDFRELNLEWLEKYDLAESHDIEIINHPKEAILDKGGYIFLAREGDRIVGTAGIANEGDSIYELVKMTVAPAFRGQGISKMLIEKCLVKARELKAKKIFLYSNSQLQTAISLYKKYGFVHVDASNSPLVTADVKMELTLGVMSNE
jgi:N-acetylglutamate synthase-like GNAT family acetyltransferase